MRNFKKILSLVLAMAMMLSVMVVGAGAFSDQDEFSAEYVTAAEALTNLGVLWGYEDGSFQPQDSITRAETAALIYRMTTGDVTDANKGNYTNMTNGFTDVKSADWFAGYVNFCANAQYVAGYGDGKFGPQDKVTGYQTLAMILRAVGFDKADEFTGADWEVKTASFAQKLGILDNVKGSEKLGEPASRELVAELLFQAMATVDLVHYAPFFGYVDVKGVTTLGDKQFDLHKVEGVVYSNEYANLSTTNSAPAEDAGETVIVYANAAGSDTYKLSTDLDIIGEQVTFWSADDVAVSTPVSKADTNTVWSDTTWEYLTAEEKTDFSKDTTDHKFYNNYDTASSVHTGKGVYVKVIENGTGFDDYVLTEAMTLGSVEYVANDGDVKLDGKAKIDTKNFVAYDGIAKDDVVLFVEIDGTTFIEKAPYITGYITENYHSFSADDAATIGGEAYNVSAIYFQTGTAEATIFDSVDDTYERNYNGLTYNYYQDAFGNIRAYAKADEEATDYALVLAFDKESQLFAPDKWYVEYLTTDGEVNTAVVDKQENYDDYKVGEVVKFRMDQDNEFVIVYTEDNGVMGSPIAKVNGKVMTNAEEKTANVVAAKSPFNGEYDVNSDLVAFYYVDMRFGGAYYGVLTGDAAIADLDANYKKITQIEATPGTGSDVVGDLAMVNVNAMINDATQYAYILGDSFSHKTDDVNGTLFYYNAVNADGETIEVVLEKIWTPAMGRVVEYVEVAQNYIDSYGQAEVVTYNYVTGVANKAFGDLHIHGTADNKFVMFKIAEDGSVAHTNAGPALKLPAKIVCVEDEHVGEAVELGQAYTDCVAGWVVYEGTGVDAKAVAIFVTDCSDGVPGVEL